MYNMLYPCHADGREQLLVSNINVALIGAGRMGSVHGANAGRHEHLRLKYVVDPNPDAVAPLQSAFARRARLDGGRAR